MTGDSTSGTADDAAAARDSGTASSSEQIRSNSDCTNVNREPVEMSVAVAMMSGPSRRSRSPKVAPLNRISSYIWAAISERPQPFDHSALQFSGLDEARKQVALHVALQEPLLVVVEQLFAVETVASAVKLPPDTPVMTSTSSSSRTRFPLPVTSSVRRSSSSTP